MGVRACHVSMGHALNADQAGAQLSHDRESMGYTTVAVAAPTRLKFCEAESWNPPATADVGHYEKTLIGDRPVGPIERALRMSVAFRG